MKVTYFHVIEQELLKLQPHSLENQAWWTRNSRASLSWIALGNTLPQNEQPSQANVKGPENSNVDNTHIPDFETDLILGLFF